MTPSAAAPGPEPAPESAPEPSPGRGSVPGGSRDARDVGQPGLLSKAAARVRARAGQGMVRVRAGLEQSVQITVAALAAYLIAEKVLGHHGPLFAATAAIVSLGYGSNSVHLRRILEVSLGCTLGIVIGDVLMYWLGRGIWQASLVLLVSVLLARFLDNGTIFSTQMGLQSVLVVLLPATVDGPFARSLDAVVGGLCALAIMALTPSDPRRQPRQELHRLTHEFAHVLRAGADALGAYRPEPAWEALDMARSTQPLLTSLDGSLRMGQEKARMGLARRGSTEEFQRYAQAAESLDNAVRNTRVLVRRIANVVETVRLRPRAVESLQTVLRDLADAVEGIGRGLTAGSPAAQEVHLRSTRQALQAVADRLDPQLLGVRTYQGEALVMLVRPLVVDLLMATGLDHEAAAAAPVPIPQALTEALDVVAPHRRPDDDAAGSERGTGRDLGRRRGEDPGGTESRTARGAGGGPGGSVGSAAPSAEAP